MNVPFYGHVRQYHNIKAEIDANITKVLESGQYVMGPMLKQFEAELAAYHGTKYAIGVGNGTDAIWLALMALGIGAGRRGHHPRQHLLRHRRGDLDRRRARPSSSIATRRPSASTRQGSRRPSRRRPRPSSPCTSTASAPTCGRSARSPTSTSSSSSRTTRRRIGAARRRLQDRRAQRRRHHQLHHPEEPRHLRRRRRRGHQQRRHRRRRSASCATTARPKRDVHSFGFNSRLDDIHAGVLSAKLKHIDRVERPAPQVGRPLHRGPARAPDLHACRTELPGYRHVFHLYVIETQEAGAPRPAGGLPGRERHRRQDPLLDRHPQAGRLSVGQGRARSPAPLANAERNAASCISLPMFPRADGGGSRLRHRRGQGPGSGTARRRGANAWHKYRVLSSSAWASAACTTPPPSMPTPASRSSASATSTRRALDERRGQARAIPATGTDAAALASDREAGRLLLLHAAEPALRDDPDRRRVRRAAHRLREARRAHQRRGLRGQRAARRAAGVKAVVSHQHRYGEHYQKVKEIDRQRRARAASTPSTARATGWMTHMLSHLIDYTLLVQRLRRRRVGDGPGRGPRQARRQPSVARLHRAASCSSRTACAASTSAAPARRTCPKCDAGGARTASARRAPKASPKSSPTAAGARSPRAASSTGDGVMNYDLDMPPYIQEMADWLDDDSASPPVQLRERLPGLRDHDGAVPRGGRGRPGRAAAHRGRQRDRDAEGAVPDRKVLLSMAANAKEYGV